MTTTYKIDGMTCGGCVAALDRAFESAAPALQKTVSLDDGGRLVIEGEHDLATVQKVVEEAGFDLRTTG